jgi:hypothetical protein
LINFEGCAVDGTSVLFCEVCFLHIEWLQRRNEMRIKDLRGVPVAELFCSASICFWL